MVDHGPDHGTMLTPLQVETLKALRVKLMGPAYRSGQYWPSEKSIADELGVSRGTLRQVLAYMSHKGMIERCPNGRIRAAGGKLNGQKLKGKRVFLWVFNPRDPIVVDFLWGASSILSLEGAGIAIAGAEYNTTQCSEIQERDFLISATESPECAGIITWRDYRSVPSDVYRLIQGKGLPLIAAEMPPPDDCLMDYVGTAHFESCRRLVHHLHGLGHKDIACLEHGDIASRYVVERVLGYRAAMEELGLRDRAQVLSPDSSPVRRPERQYEEFVEVQRATFDWVAEQQQLAHELINKVTALKRRPTALLSTYDTSAEFIYGEISRRGWAIPDDMSLAGFAVKRRVTSAGVIEPSGVIIDFEDIGRQTARLLIERIAYPSVHGHRQVGVVAPIHGGETAKAPFGRDERRTVPYLL